MYLLFSIRDMRQNNKFSLPTQQWPLALNNNAWPPPVESDLLVKDLSLGHKWDTNRCRQGESCCVMRGRSESRPVTADERRDKKDKTIFRGAAQIIHRRVHLQVRKAPEAVSGITCITRPNQQSSCIVDDVVGRLCQERRLCGQKHRTQWSNLWHQYRL